MILLYVGADCKISWGACNRKALDSKWEGNKIFDHWRCGYFWFNVKTVKPKNGSDSFNVLQVVKEATDDEVKNYFKKEFNSLMESKGYKLVERIAGKRVSTNFKWAFFIYQNDQGKVWLYPDETDETKSYNDLIFDIAIYNRSDSGKHREQADREGDQIRKNEKSYDRVISGNYNFSSNGNNTIIIGVRNQK